MARGNVLSGRFDASESWRAVGSRATLWDMADLILIAVSLALAAYYVIRLFKFIPAAQQSKRRDRITESARRSETRP